jgi:FPC/CPF motif-containing protein YcgG
LRALVLDPEFPCVGARSAMNQAAYRFGMYAELASEEATAQLASDLERFVGEQADLPGEFSTFVTCFDTPKVRDPLEFEALADVLVLLCRASVFRRRSVARR